MARLDLPGVALLAAATTALMLTCVWGGERYALASWETLALAGATVAAGVGLVAWERRAADPVVPLHLLRTRVVAVASTALFLATAALFAVTVFVPLFLQATTGATPTEAGLLLVPAMLGITVATTIAGRSVARTGRYKRFPVVGLALMAAGLALLAVVAGDPSRLTTGIGLAVFGLGFGMVGQILITAVQNGVERRELGVAPAATAFFRALGGAIGAAILAAVFAARVGEGASLAVGPAVQAVFLAGGGPRGPRAGRRPGSARGAAARPRPVGQEGDAHVADHPHDGPHGPHRIGRGARRHDRRTCRHGRARRGER